jgi:hypothetical protein
MFGDGIGSLNIYRRLGSTLPDILWKKSGSQDNIWRLATISLPKLSTLGNYTIFFEGTKGKSVRGDLF